MYILSRKDSSSQSDDRVSAHLQYVCYPAENMHKQGGIPLSVCILLWWVGLVCTHCFCFHPSESDNYRSPLFWAVVTCVVVPQAMQRDQGRVSRGVDCCGCLQSAGNARWLPDWFSRPLPILYHHPFLSVSEMHNGGFIFWTSASQILLRWALVYLCAWGLIYEQKSSRVQFLVTEADNGGDWMKQLVTSFLLLTSAGCWPISLKGALLGIDVRGRSYLNRFLLLILKVYSQST